MLLLVIFATVIALGVAIHLGAQAAANKIKNNPDPYPLDTLLKEPEGETVIITREDGTKIRAVSAGVGPAVVLAHGYAYSLLEWNIIWSELIARGYRVIAFDQRGHGQSTIGADGVGSRQMAGDYKAVLEHFDVRDAILVGHSMGGFLAIVFMLTHPEVRRERLKGVVLFATFAGNVLQGSLQNRFQIPLLRAGIIQWAARSRTYGWLFGMSLCGDNPSPAAIQAFLKGFLVQRHNDLLPILRAFGDEDYYARLKEIDLPCVVICGELDKTTPRWHSERMGQDIPNARNVWVKGKGHLLNWEAPESLIEAVVSF